MTPGESIHQVVGLEGQVADAIAIAIPANIVAPVVAFLDPPQFVACCDELDLGLVADEVVAVDLVVDRTGPQMHADPVIDDQVVADRVVLGVIDEETARVAGHDIALDHRILDRAQHDAVVRIGPRPVVAHDLIAGHHQRQAAAVVVGFVVLPDIVVGVHVVGAVAHVVDAVALEQRTIRHIDVDAVTHETDLVADDPRPHAEVELDAVAALGGRVVALAGDDVVADHHVVGLFDPQAEQHVRELAVVHHRAVRTALEIDAGILGAEIVAGVGDDETVDDDVGRGDADGVAGKTAVDRREAGAGQGQGLVDVQVFAIAAGQYPQHVAGTRRVDRGLNRIPGPQHRFRGCGRPRRDQQEQQQRPHQTTTIPAAFSSRNRLAPINRFLKPT